MCYDICLMAPRRPAALQELINIFYDFSVRNVLSFKTHIFGYIL